MAGHAVRVHEDHAQLEFGSGRPHYGNMFRVTEDCRCAAVFQKLGDLIGMQGRVEGNGGAARGDDSQVRRDPVRVIIGQNCESGSVGKSVLGNPPANRFGHAVQFFVGAAFDVIVALEFERDIGRPALRAFNKAIVEGGHSSWRIYTKSGSGRCARGASRDSRLSPPPPTRSRTWPVLQRRWSTRSYCAERPQPWGNEG